MSRKAEPEEEMTELPSEHCTLGQSGRRKNNALQQARLEDKGLDASATVTNPPDQDRLTLFPKEFRRASQGRNIPQSKIGDTTCAAASHPTWWSYGASLPTMVELLS
ncbi:hypothetical protein AG0111_0g12940 [Alternaria gaisen]|uniref:Uncharacterized protein n=1 Tax=Alternaria gaisen TaxID=167740 RepID=A0ACB6F357_9PLEO|nr:hypothetical protein AG0111_0g12940 [Alternaria gaisen]